MATAPRRVRGPAGRSRRPAKGQPPIDRRARRKEETRQRLLAAARTLFATRGYDATRPQDIARAADLAAGTFYVHFADKRDAFVAFTEQAAEELMALQGERMGGASCFEERVHRSLEALFEYAEHNPGVLSAAFADHVVIAAEVPTGASLRERLAESLARGLRHDMQAGELSADYDPHVIAYGIVGMIHAACVYGARHDLSRDALLDDLTRFCARALAVPDRNPTEAIR